MGTIKLDLLQVLAAGQLASAAASLRERFMRVRDRVSKPTNWASVCDNLRFVAAERWDDATLWQGDAAALKAMLEDAAQTAHASDNIK